VIWSTIQWWNKPAEAEVKEMTEEEKKIDEEQINQHSSEKEEGKPSEKKAESSSHVSRHDHEVLKEQLERAQADCKANLDGWQRERAEFSNYKKRIDRENAQLSQTITGSVIKKYLVILDDIELALKAKPTSGEGAAWAEGIELIDRKLQAILDSEGIERINQNNVPFDPNLHEAISNEEIDGFESGDVIEVVRQGYKLGDRILRPAMVRVAR
jgi:molecular chaperone GrpE